MRPLVIDALKPLRPFLLGNALDAVQRAPGRAEVVTLVTNPAPHTPSPPGEVLW